MSATIQAKASTTLLFGIESGIAALSGYICNDADLDYSSKNVSAYDSQGSTVAIAYFDQMIDLKFNALLVSGTTLPTIGATVTVNSIMYVCEKVSKKEKNNNFTYVTLDLKRYSDNLIPNA